MFEASTVAIFTPVIISIILYIIFGNKKQKLKRNKQITIVFKDNLPENDIGELLYVIYANKWRQIFDIFLKFIAIIILLLIYYKYAKHGFIQYFNSSYDSKLCILLIINYTLTIFAELKLFKYSISICENAIVVSNSKRDATYYFNNIEIGSTDLVNAMYDHTHEYYIYSKEEKYSKFSKTYKKPMIAKILVRDYIDLVLIEDYLKDNPAVKEFVYKDETAENEQTIKEQTQK